MVKNTIHTQDETSPVFLQVLSILGIKKEKIKNLEEDYRKNIDSILEKTPKARENKKLALYLINEVDVGYFYKLSAKLQGDKTIALAALKQDSKIYFRLPLVFQKQMFFAQETIKSLVREKTNFVEIEKFLTKNFPETKIFTDLFGFYRKYLKVAEYFFYNDVEKQLIQLREKDKKTYNLIFEKRLLENRGKRIVVGEDFSKFFLGQVSLITGIENISQAEKTQKYLQIFQGYLSLPNADMTEELQVFFESILDLIHIKKQKKKIEKEEDIPVKEEDEESDYIKEEELEERLDFCIPYCNYNAGDDGACDLQIGNNIHIHLSEEEMKRINNKALKNYVEGIKKLTELGFGFALYHQERFFNLCGVDHIYGEGLSDAKILKILNKVGKNIGVPEKNFTNNNEEKEVEKKVGCFRSVEDAIFQFRRIRDTGKIQENDTSPIIEVSKKGNKSILRHICESKELFDSQGGAFNISQWK